MSSYVKSLTAPVRRKTREVRVGHVPIGGHAPIVVQSMTTPSTLDTKATVDQIERLVNVGCEIVRVTTPSMADADNLPNIRCEMKARKLQVPLVADVHFLPKIALKACDYVEKVRINPGNFADKKRFDIKEYTDSEYQAELERIRETFVPIVRRAKENGVALRIGTNHGSLSDRIMNRYGDTPKGMVESAIEFLEIAEDEGFKEMVLSMKASNTQVMIQAYRLLVKRMDELDMTYPLHLGVTEAGDGEDGRTKSAIGIGSLLQDGLGDTIRVSLTEDPEAEVPVARRLADLYGQGPQPSAPDQEISPPWDFYSYNRRNSQVLRGPVFDLGFGKTVRVRSHVRSSDIHALAQAQKIEPQIESLAIEDVEIFRKNESVIKGLKSSVLFRLRQQNVKDVFESGVHFNELSLRPSPGWSTSDYIGKLKDIVKDRPLWMRVGKDADIENLISTWPMFSEHFNVGVEVEGPLLVILARKLVSEMERAKITAPVHLHFRAVPSENEHDVLLRAATEIGSLLCDGIGDSIEASSGHSLEFNHRLAFNILQASRLRMSKTEYIACPSCGRTLFDLQETTARIREKTGHLKGLKIAIMGCIVNGPGEMADADFGYVGSGPGFINLYVGKDCVARKIPQKDADARLIQLIQDHGKWVDPSPSA